MKRHSGFTLIELMITLFIVSILLTVGVPSLRTFMQGNQLIAATNELVSALHVARSEAIKLNTRVSICESSNGTSCSATGDWSNGWIVFVDADGGLDNTGAPCTSLNTDCLLRVHEKIDDDNLTIKGKDANSATVSAFTFTSRGIPKTLNGALRSGVFSLCSLDDNGGVINARAVVLGLSGRVRASSNEAVISCP